MSFSVSGNKITLTRGDTFLGLVAPKKDDGTSYIPKPGDKIRFAMKSNYSDAEPLLIKDIPIDTLKLVLEPKDTKNLQFGTYVYDIQLTTASGIVDTFITKAKLVLTEEVD